MSLLRSVAETPARSLPSSLARSPSRPLAKPFPRPLASSLAMPLPSSFLRSLAVPLPGSDTHPARRSSIPGDIRPDTTLFGVILTTDAQWIQPSIDRGQEYGGVPNLALRTYSSKARVSRFRPFLSVFTAMCNSFIAVFMRTYAEVAKTDILWLYSTQVGGPGAGTWARLSE